MTSTEIEQLRAEESFEPTRRQLQETFTAGPFGASPNQEDDAS